MPRLLVKITQGKWFTDLPWLAAGELQAAALFDLRFRDNRLSVWSIDDDFSNLSRVVAALAANAPHSTIEVFDYVLIEKQSIVNIGTKIEKAEGGTPDHHANKEWHYDLVELSATKIVEVAHLIREEADFVRVLAHEVKGFLTKGLQDRHITIDGCAEKLRPALKKLID